MFDRKDSGDKDGRKEKDTTGKNRAFKTTGGAEKE